MGDVLKELLRTCVRRGDALIGTSGASLDGVYIDAKSLLGQPDSRSLVADALRATIPSSVSCVVGMGVGGTFATIASDGRALCLLRDGVRSHGLQTPFASYKPKPDERLWLIDDIYTTGSSLRNMQQILASTGAQVIGVTVLVARSEPTLGVSVTSLYRIDELL